MFSLETPTVMLESLVVYEAKGEGWKGKVLVFRVLSRW